MLTKAKTALFALRPPPAVLHDEIGMTADGLQELTFRLCFLYAHATRAVSICPAIYYADEAASAHSKLVPFRLSPGSSRVVVVIFYKHL